MEVYYSFRCLIKHYHRIIFLRTICSVHSPSGDPRMHNVAISRLIRSGHLHQAQQLFDSLPDRDRNIVTWNSMLSVHARGRSVSRARDLFDRMPHRDAVSWSTMLSCYASSLDLGEARRLFDAMPQRDSCSWNTMMSAYTHNGLMEDAMYLFNKMPRRTIVSWNVMITGFLDCGNVWRAMELFESMPERDTTTFSTLVSGLVRNGRLGKAEEILLRSGRKFDGAISAYNTLIAGYAQCGKVEEARTLFYLIPKTSQKQGGFGRNVVTWNSMIKCYVKARDLRAARALFEEMPIRDVVSWNTMIHGYVQNLEMDKAVRLIERMPAPDAWSWNAIICGFTRKGEMELAREYFEHIPRKSVTSWNTMIVGYEQNGDYGEAFAIFHRMQANSERPDRHTLSSLLSVCSGLASLSLGIQIHQIIMKTLLPDAPINNALITMYSRCGSMLDAKFVFNGMRMHERDVISWNAMIGGFAQHGHAKGALLFFEKMKMLKIRPTYITFISLLHACCHAGLVDEGKKLFNSMVHVFRLTPKVEHYASLVDLIGRHGMLEDAMKVINEMVVPPDKSVWGALLGACRIHSNVKLAKVAAEALAKVEPESSAPYVMLYNVHADKGSWIDAMEAREVMDRHKIVKKPGYSWIELQHRIHIFIAGDRSHPLSFEIYSLLESCDRISRCIPHIISKSV